MGRGAGRSRSSPTPEDRMSRVVFSEAARIDRRSITAYSVERFGIEQARRLRERFQATLNALAEPPLLGRTNEDLDPPGHSFRYFVVMKIFIIAYESTDNRIRVVRLLHGARNLAAELDRDAGDDD
ncbi:MAG: type II toxin-antitoxin system RelE/ParE family toxin [Planctomycetota bacterium]|nr:MAG: type II toxin-antitoxin system RelE/ParE family toxin [Planctomycetota bacterium]